MANVAELDRVMTFIEDHPDLHAQNVWTCGTQACMAGHAALMNGWRSTSINGWMLPRDSNVPAKLLEDTHAYWQVRYFDAVDLLIPSSVSSSSRPDARDTLKAWHKAMHELGARQADDIAREVLDLTETEGEILFHGRNTRDNMRKMVKTLMNGEDLAKAFVVPPVYSLGYVPVEEA